MTAEVISLVDYKYRKKKEKLIKEAEEINQFCNLQELNERLEMLLLDLSVINLTDSSEDSDLVIDMLNEEILLIRLAISIHPENLKN